jgi:hypothetical protein
MLAATFIATLFTPLFFRWIAGWGERRAARRATSQAVSG